jgi:hypothetical protein
MRFDALRESLLKGGVAPRHVRRYVRELSEHLDDLTAQQRAAGYDGDDAAIRARARLGSDTELASAMLEQKQFRSLAACAPWLVFGLLPPFAALAAVFAPLGVVILIGMHFGLMARRAPPPPEWYQTLAHSVVTGSDVVLVPLAAALFAGIAFRQRLHLVWPLITTALLLMLFVHSEAHFPSPGHSGSSVSVNLSPVFLSSSWRTITAYWPVATAQYFLTLLPVLWLACRTVRQ